MSSYERPRYKISSHIRINRRNSSKFLIQKVIFLVFIILIICIVLLSYQIINVERERMINSIVEQKTALSETIAMGLESAEVHVVPAYKRQVVEEVGKQEDVLYCRVVKYTGEIYITSIDEEVGTNIDNSAISTDKTIVIDDIFNGEKIKTVVSPTYRAYTVWVGFSLEKVDVAIQSMIVGNVGISICIIILAVVVYFGLSTVNRELRKTKEYTENIVTSMADTLIIMSFEGKIENVNKSTIALLGYQKQELIGESIDKIISPLYAGTGTDIVFGKTQLEKLLQKGSIRNTEVNYTTKNKRKIPMSLSCSVIKSDEDELQGIVCIAKDITERKQWEEELKKSKQRIELQNVQLKKLDELKTAFLNVTSHELRTPMTTIKGYVQMLLKQGFGDLTEKQKECLDVTLRNADRLDRLIEDILDVSRLESGTMKFIPGKIDIKMLVDETVESLRPYADLKEIMINADVEEDGLQLFIDGERIKQVIMNLVNNAIKFSPGGSIVNLKVKKDKKDVLFEVQDFGRGIPKDKQNKVFDLFYQVEAGMDRKFGGAGLGLAISRGIVMAHGGRIWVESKEGEGSDFKFTVPVDPIKDLERQFESVDMFLKESGEGREN